MTSMKEQTFGIELEMNHILRTKAAGWPLGKTVSVQWQRETAEGLVTERSVDADSAEGSWETEILMEVTL